MSKNPAPQRGLTVLETIIAIGLLGLILSVALPLYMQYRTGANMLRVTNHVEEGARFAQCEFMAIRQNIDLGLQKAEYMDHARNDADAKGWIDALNEIVGQAPGGGDAFAAAADDDRGVVGVAVSSPTGFAAGDLVLTLTRPAFGEFATRFDLHVGYATILDVESCP